MLSFARPAKRGAKRQSIEAGYFPKCAPLANGASFRIAHEERTAFTGASEQPRRDSDHCEMRTSRQVSRPRTPWFTPGAVLWLPYKGSMVRLEKEAILRVEAERDYVRVYDATRSYLLRATMSHIAVRLGDGFLRIHRSTMIARGLLVALRHSGGGSWRALDPHGSEYPIGRTYLPEVRKAILMYG
jgi:DNA-binding LytR/AlgR family response regulator